LNTMTKVIVMINCDKPDACIVELAGELDMNTSVEFRNKLQSLLKKGPKMVVVDLSGVRYMDSSGIATLVEGYQESYKANLGFYLVGIIEQVRKFFELANLIDFFKIYHSIEDVFMVRNGD